MALLEGILGPSHQDSMLDCSIIKTMYNLNLISSTDYFYPLVDDPYIQGHIGAANVISDIYALGIPHIDNVLMILAASSNIQNKQHRDIVTSEMMRGFIDCCELAQTRVSGGHSVKNPWPMIGGCAQTVVDNDSYISPYNGQCGDYLVLTKPLGTQITVNLAEWKAVNGEKYKHLLDDQVIDDEIANKITNIGKGSMMRINRTAAELMISEKYKKYMHGATDVTGFGLLGHAQNLCIHQDVNRKSNGAEGLQFVIDTLPIIKYCDLIDDAFDGKFRLSNGLSAETSGGLLVMVEDKNVAQDFVDELSERDGWPAWIVGKVRKYESENGITMKEAAIIDDDFDYVHVFE